jgi:hypothetical protein
MGEIAGQQIILVVLLQIIAYLGHHRIWYNCTILSVSLDLDILEPGARIDVDISTLKEIGAEAPEPAQIVVPGNECVVALDVDVVQELRYNKMIQLEHVKHLPFLLDPFPEDLQVTDIADYRVFAEATVVQPLIEVIMIKICYRRKEGICQGIRALYPWVPATLELSGDIVDHYLGCPEDFLLRLTAAQEILLSLSQSGYGVKGIEIDIIALAQYQLGYRITLYFIISRVCFRKIIFFSHTLFCMRD